MFQSTLPRGERLLMFTPSRFVITVSIHAPAWGATVLARNDPRHSICFNPRSRVGSDDCRGFILVGCGVSIHAPAWGATVKVPTTESLQIVSIHAPAWGATLPGNPHGKGWIVSIHAPAWGATGLSSCPKRCTVCFNPRSRVGSDDYPAQRGL